MKIDIQKLKTGPETVFLDHRPAYFNLKGDDYEVTENVTGKLTFSAVGDKYIMKGKVKTRFRMQCVRCLEDVEFPIEKDVFVVYYQKEELPEEEHEEEIVLDPEEIQDEFSTFRGKMIKPVEDIRQLLLIDLPHYPKCDEKCRGLCPMCGKNLNRESCNCEEKMEEEFPEKESSLKKQLKKIKKQIKE